MSNGQRRGWADWVRSWGSFGGRKRKNPGGVPDGGSCSRFRRGLPQEGVESGVITIHEESLKSIPTLEDTRWSEVGYVDRLYVYPLKSARGVSLSRAKVQKYGLSSSDGVLLDRQFMVIDRQNHFTTARKYSKLVLVRADVIDGKFRLSAPGMPDLSVVLPTHDDSSAESVKTSVWYEKCSGYDLGQSASDWMGKYIDDRSREPFRILYHPFNPNNYDYNPRKKPTGHEDLTPNARPHDTSLFADHYGFMLMTKSSLDELNRKLQERKIDLRVDVRRFRPNIFIKDTGGKPFDEDNWLYLKINKTIFRNAKYCTRCVFTLIDPDTGKRNPKFEPLKTLKSFRSSLDPRERKVYFSAPFFGINLGLDDVGVGEYVSLRDKLFVIRNCRTSTEASSSGC